MKLEYTMQKFAEIEQHFQTQLSQEKWKGRMVGVWVGGILCKGDQESHAILYISDKNGTSKLNKLAIFDQKWNFLNLVAMFDK